MRRGLFASVCVAAALPWKSGSPARLDALRVAIKQLDPKCLFQIGYRLRNNRLCDSEICSRLGHTASLHLQQRRHPTASMPYRGVTLATQDLVARQIELMFDGPVNSLPQVRANRINAYAPMQ